MASFNKGKALHSLKHYLPSQTPLKDFIHHNSLHAFQEHSFYKAIFSASTIFGYHVTFNLNEYRRLFETGRIREDVLDRIIEKQKKQETFKEFKNKVLNKKYTHVYEPRIGLLRREWKSRYHIDLDNLTQPLLFRVLGSYLDQGISAWDFPRTYNHFLKDILENEKNSFFHLFQSKRIRRLISENSLSLENLLQIVVGNPDYFEQYLFDQQFTHRGWSGMVSTIEDKPDSLLYPLKISLEELIIFELLLEIDALDNQLGEDWKPIAEGIAIPPTDILGDVDIKEWQHVLSVWQDAFEWSYYDEVLSAIVQVNAVRAPKRSESETSFDFENSPRHFQAVFCIDERECSLRRHIEHVDPLSQTFGCPGFFGVEFYFQPFNGKFYEKLCPAPVTPKYLIKENATAFVKHHDPYFSKDSHTVFKGLLSALSLGIWSPVRLFLNLFRPSMSPAISNAFSHMNIEGALQVENDHPKAIENGLQLGFTVDEMTVRVESVLRGIGMIQHFASIIYMVAHGSSSANNPHHGAHDCGACSGRPGATNARVFSFMANHPGVRERLKRNGIVIPEETIFVGSMHDTASDEIVFYDTHLLNESLKNIHQQHVSLFENALDLNAKERSRRFASIDVNKPIKHVRHSIKKRAVSFFEPRPELGHGTNALCFVGNRSVVKNIFFDRRAFMNSYDYRTDPDGHILLQVIRPLPPVCGGINLEYYFSRVDNSKLGAGTKLPHNVIGLIGVSNSSDGDLRPGLPLQMIEVHDPVRLLLIVEHYPDIVLSVVKKEATLYQWFEKEWVHLVVLHPEKKSLYVFCNGFFEPYETLNKDIKVMHDIHAFIEQAPLMKTNHILDATKENMDTHVLNIKQ